MVSLAVHGFSRFASSDVVWRQPWRSSVVKWRSSVFNSLGSTGGSMRGRERGVHPPQPDTHTHPQNPCIWDLITYIIYSLFITRPMPQYEPPDAKHFNLIFFPMRSWDIHTLFGYHSVKPENSMFVCGWYPFRHWAASIYNDRVTNRLVQYRKCCILCIYYVMFYFSICNPLNVMPIISLGAILGSQTKFITIWGTLSFLSRSRYMMPQLRYDRAVNHSF